jgi:HK97 family phage prohead protease
MSIKLNYNIPFTIESSVTGETGNSDFVIEGIAINSTTTDNNHKFLSEELSNAAISLTNVPLLKDHSNNVDSIVGRVIKASFNEEGKNVIFKAKINDTESGLKVRQLIKSGDLNTVSVGANVTSMDKGFESDSDVLVPRGIIFKELSLVAVPADGDAKFTYHGGNFNLALKEAYIHSKNDTSLTSDIIKLEKKMTENEKIVQVESSINFEERINQTDEKLKAQTDILSQLVSDVKSIKDFMLKLETEANDKVKCPECGKMVPKESLKAHIKADKEDAKDGGKDESTEMNKVTVKAEVKTEVKAVTPLSVESSDNEIEEEINLDEKDKVNIIQDYRSFTVTRKYR